MGNGTLEPTSHEKTHTSGHGLAILSVTGSQWQVPMTFDLPPICEHWYIIVAQASELWMGENSYRTGRVPRH